MKKKVIIGIISVLVVALGYKSYTFFKYSDKEKTDLQDIKISGNINVSHIELENKDYIVYKDMKFKNIFAGYDKMINSETSITMKEKRGNKAVFIGKHKQFINAIKESNEYKPLLNIIEENDIKNDLDLIKYIEKHNKDKVQFLMTTNKQKEISALTEFRRETFPSITSIKALDGYYKGYMYINTFNNIKEVNLLKDDNAYYFSFNGDFSDEYIAQFIDTVII